MPANPTIAQALDQRAKRTAATPASDVGIIASVDPVTREVILNTAGWSGPRRVTLAAHLLPLIKQMTPGSRLKIEMIDGDPIGTWFVATNFLPLVGKSMAGGNAPVRTALAAPVITLCQQNGTLVQVAWTAVTDSNGGGVVYELWSNSAKSPNGAALIATLPGTSHSGTIDAGGSPVYGELVVNGTFEGGNTDGWYNDGYGIYHKWIATNAEHHSGAWSIRYNYNTSSSYFFTFVRGWNGAQGIPMRIVPSTTYHFSISYKIAAQAALGRLTANIIWMDGATNVLRYDSLLNQIKAVGDWVTVTQDFIAPANAVYLDLEVLGDTQNAGDSIDVYVDDISVIGAKPYAGADTVYMAVRAVAADGSGASSSLSEWVQVMQGTASFGPQSAAMRLDAATGRMVGDTGTNAPAISIGPLGLTTNGWEQPLAGNFPPNTLTPVYVSATTVTVSGDVTGLPIGGPGIKVRFKQNAGTWQYAKTAGSATYSGATIKTTITLVFEAGSALTAGQSITNFYYSQAETPQGYPLAAAPAPPGMVLIADQVLGADAATIDFSSIPATYKHLRLEISTRSDLAGQVNDQTDGIRFNNDSAGNYDAMIAVHLASNTTSVTQTNGATSGRYGTMPANNAVANDFSNYTLTVIDYANATREKSWHSEGGYRQAAGQYYATTAGGTWKSTAAINRVTFILGGTSKYKAGSRATLYGLA